MSSGKKTFGNAQRGFKPSRAQTKTASPRPSRIKPPERCPDCASPRVSAKGHRRKKFETVRMYRCGACERRFTPGPRPLRGKTYPVREILDAFTDFNRGRSLEEVARRLTSRHGQQISPSTISRWLSAHPQLTTYRRLRERGRKLFSPHTLIRIIKLYHKQVYEFRRGGHGAGACAGWFRIPHAYALCQVRQPARMICSRAMTARGPRRLPTVSCGWTSSPSSKNRTPPPRQRR